MPCRAVLLVRCSLPASAWVSAQVRLANLLPSGALITSWGTAAGRVRPAWLGPTGPARLCRTAPGSRPAGAARHGGGGSDQIQRTEEQRPGARTTSVRSPRRRVPVSGTEPADGLKPDRRSPGARIRAVRMSRGRGRRGTWAGRVPAAPDAGPARSRSGRAGGSGSAGVGVLAAPSAG